MTDRGHRTALLVALVFGATLGAALMSLVQRSDMRDAYDAGRTSRCHR